MISRRTRVQLFAFVLIALLGVGYTGFRYAGVDRLFGAHGTLVTVRMTDTGGIFPNADVTYRGVTVGTVTDVRLGDHGTEVHLDIDADAPAIPRDVQIVVANRSAVGEQYVNLVPRGEDTAPLTDGTVIAAKDTTVPPTLDTLLYNVNSLLTSVPTDDLATLVDELGTGFADSGPDLTQLLQAADSFAAAANQHLPQTTRLIDDAQTVLATQNAASADITEFSANLKNLAGALRTADPHLRATLDNTPAAVAQVSALLAESGNGLGQILANLLTTSLVLEPRSDHLRQLLVGLPMLTAVTDTVLRPDDKVAFGLALNFFDPLPCARGYEETVRRSGDDDTPIATNTDAYCAEPPGSPTNVRGSSRAPFPGMPEAVPQPGQAQPSPSAAPALPGYLSAPGLGAPSTLAGLLGLAPL